MNFRFFQKEEKEEKKRRAWISLDVRLFLLFSFLLFNSIRAGPFDDQFFGADRNKIKETPKYLKICHKSDKNLDKCIKSSLEKLIESLNSGSEELNLPNLDPIKIPVLEFQLGSGNVSLHTTFKDFRINGFKQFKVTNVRSNLNDKKFEISVENPLVTMSARFSSQGGVFTFPISAEGDFFFNLTDVSAVFIFRLSSTQIEPGLSFFTVENSLVDLLSSDINASFGEFIDGSNAIGEAFNTFLNSNAHEIFTLIKPNISKTLANIFDDIANEILSRHPEEVLLPD